MKYLLLLVATATMARALLRRGRSNDLPPTCDRLIYCGGVLLRSVQLARLYPDSKTFVDKQLRIDETTTLDAFQELLNKTNNNPSKEELQVFVDDYFDSTSELETWTPSDYSSNPEFLNGIKDDSLRQFGKNINDIWPHLGRKVKPIVLEKPELFSFIPVNNGFIIPGGRFREIYYWDTYWIIEGLLISGMKDTARGMIENLIGLVRKLGHVPNGSRWYYQRRSHPPLLSAMVSLYVRATNDLDFLRSNIQTLEAELEYWLDTQLVTFKKNGRDYSLLRYYAPSEGPRPESYYEDYTNAQIFKTQRDQSNFYVEIKSAAESGWDFSTRWFKDPEGNLTTIRTHDIIPVDLNAIFAKALQNTAKFRSLLHDGRKGAHWAYLAKQWRNNIREVFWNENDGIWYDYDLATEQHRKHFYPSNLAPLWMGAVDKQSVKAHSAEVLKYLKNSHGLDYPGGVPATLINSGEQWDFPNAWPPLISIVVNALEALGTSDANEVAFHVAQNWVRSCYKGFVDYKQMFEKYNVELPGVGGGGGEYGVQEGFGWSNGVILEFLKKYGRRLTATDEIRVNGSENTSGSFNGNSNGDSSESGSKSLLDSLLSGSASSESEAEGDDILTPLLSPLGDVYKSL